MCLILSVHCPSACLFVGLLTHICDVTSLYLVNERDVEAGCDRRPPVSSTSARRDLLLLAIICYCRPATLEESTCRRPVCPVTHNISS